MGLRTIEDFFESVFKESGTAIATAFGRQERGEYQRLADYYADIEPPMFRREIAARAVYHELWSLVEGELQKSASEAWKLSKKHKGLKCLAGLPLTAENLRRLRLVSDLGPSALTELIESHYGIVLGGLPGASTVFELKAAVDAFKHRRSFEDWRQLDHSALLKLPEQHKPSADDVHRAIEHVALFINALWKATGREPSPLNPESIDWGEDDDEVAPVT